MNTTDNWHKENGFEFALFPAKTDTPDSLIIHLHGVGGNACDLDESFGALYHEKCPGADVVAMQAPLRHIHPDQPPEKKGYAWFPHGNSLVLHAKTYFQHILGITPVIKQVAKFAQAEMEKRGLSEENVSFVGHSMGAIVALQVALRAAKPVASVVSMGGAVPALTKINSQPDIFLQMGEIDYKFNRPAPPKKGTLMNAFNGAKDRFSMRHAVTVSRLEKAGVSVTAKIYPGKGHILTVDEVKEGADFIATTLKRKKFGTR